MRLPDFFHLGALPIGIDVGASGVRMLQLRRRGRGLEVIAASRVELEPSDDRGRARAIAESVSRRVLAGGFVGRRCVLSIDNRLVRVRSVRVPPMPDEDLARAMRLDAPARLGFPESEPAQFAWIRAGSVRQSGDPREEVLVIGASSKPIEELVFLLAEHGLRPEGVEASFVAAARATTRQLRRASDQETVRVLVDVGHLTSGVTITRGQTVAFHKQLETGGHSMTLAASQRLGLEPAVIAQMRRQRAARAARGLSDGDPKVDRALFEAARSLMGDLANEVSLCLRHFGVTFRGSRPEWCALAGGEAHEPKLGQVIGECLRLPVCTASPLDHIRCAGASGVASDWELEQSAWAVASGLSLRNLPRRGIATLRESPRADESPERGGDIAPVEQRRAAA